MASRMSLSERAKIKPVRTYGTPCSVGHLLETLEGAELDAFLAMLGTPEQRGWSARDIYVAVTAEGHEIGFQSINRHRGGNCKCHR